MKPILENYVRLFYPGTIMTESSEHKIDSFDPSLVNPSKSCFGFQFFQRKVLHDNVELKSKEINHSSKYYYGEKLSLEDVKNSDDSKLLGVMLSNKYTSIVKTVTGNHFNLSPKDVVLPPTEVHLAKDYRFIFDEEGSVLVPLADAKPVFRKLHNWLSFGDLEVKVDSVTETDYKQNNSWKTHKASFGYIRNSQSGIGTNFDSLSYFEMFKQGFPWIYLIESADEGDYFSISARANNLHPGGFADVCFETLNADLLTCKKTSDSLVISFNDTCAFKNEAETFYRGCKLVLSNLPRLKKCWVGESNEDGNYFMNYESDV